MKQRLIGGMGACTILLTLISGLAQVQSLSSPTPKGGEDEDEVQTLAEAPSCRLEAYTPVQEWGNGLPIEEACRQLCVQDRTITVVLRRDKKWGPDETLGEETLSGVVNYCLTVRWEDCEAGESALAFTEIRTNAGGKTQSDCAVVYCPW